jgi:hypothetical protein
MQSMPAPMIASVSVAGSPGMNTGWPPGGFTTFNDAGSHDAASDITAVVEATNKFNMVNDPYLMPFFAATNRDL